MSKAGYIGVESAARKIKKMYVGVDGIARKVKKAYVGVDGVARLWFSAGTKITYTGIYMRQAITNGGTEYNLYTLLKSGTLSVEGDPVEYWMCGGGGGGANSTKVIKSAQINTVHSTGGGAGAYAESGQVIGNGIAVLIGAGGSAESDGGASTLGDAAANGGGAAPTTVYVNNYYGRDAVMGGSGGSGGGSTLVFTSSEVNMGIGGSGDGKSKVPFEISELKAHCAGGGGGAHYYEVDKSAYATGGAGGSNGSDGGEGEYMSVDAGNKKGGAGGEYGGGAGANASSTDNASNNGNNATFYGGGGGGVAYYETSSKQYKGTTAGKGYQGVVYLLVPKENDESEEPATPYTLTITGADSTSYVKTGGTSYMSATEMYVNNGQEVTVYAYGRYNTIKANGTTVASNSSFSQKTISYTFTVSASTTIAFSSGSATITY